MLQIKVANKTLKKKKDFRQVTIACFGKPFVLQCQTEKKQLIIKKNCIRKASRANQITIFTVLRPEKCTKDDQ